MSQSQTYFLTFCMLDTHHSSEKSEMFKIQLQQKPRMTLVTIILILVFPIIFYYSFLPSDHQNIIQELPSDWYISNNQNCISVLPKICFRFEKNNVKDTNDIFKYILLWNTFFEDESFEFK